MEIKRKQKEAEEKEKARADADMHKRNAEDEFMEQIVDMGKEIQMFVFVTISLVKNIYLKCLS